MEQKMPDRKENIIVSFHLYEIQELVKIVDRGWSNGNSGDEV